MSNKFKMLQLAKSFGNLFIKCVQSLFQKINRLYECCLYPISLPCYWDLQGMHYVKKTIKKKSFHNIEGRGINENGDCQYIWGSIIRDENYGNGIIELCLKEILEIRKPDLVVDVKKSTFPENAGKYSFIINPGTTTLYQKPAVDMAYSNFNANLPVICFGASLWFRKDWGLKFRRGDIVQYAKKMNCEIGCRDPFTSELLEQEKIEYRFIGCPTLFPIANLISSNKTDDYIAFSFGRQYSLGKQLDLLTSLMKNNCVKICIHEPAELKICERIRVNGHNVISGSNPANLLKTYYNARAIVTGRLHAALPGIAASKPVYFFRDRKTFDSRWTLLDYLKLPIYDIDRSTLGEYELNQCSYDKNRVNILKTCFKEYVKAAKQEFQL